MGGLAHTNENTVLASAEKEPTPYTADSARDSSYSPLPAAARRGGLWVTPFRLLEWLTKKTEPEGARARSDPAGFFRFESWFRR